MTPQPCCFRWRLVAAVLALILVSAACGSDNDSQDLRLDPAAAAAAALTKAAAELDPNVLSDAAPVSEPVTTTTEPPLAQENLIDPYLLSIDECFDRTKGLSAGRERESTTRLDCFTPHHFQIFGFLDYPAEGPSYYPGDNIMEDYALASCYQRFEDWSQSIYETSALEIRAFTPNRTNFEPPTNYRGIQCYVERSDRDPLVGTARGAGL